VVISGAGCTFALLSPFTADIILNFDSIRYLPSRVPTCPADPRLHVESLEMTCKALSPCTST
jgi:hypothetical protein